jgi:hypothetical protein
VAQLRRFACLIAGAWLAASLFMAYVATQNFASVDRLLAQPAAQAGEHIRTLGAENARALLRYQVSEQNRWYFEHWETMQLALALVFLATLAGSGTRGWVLLAAALMLAIVVGQKFYLTPQIVSLGRLIDFVPIAPQTPERARFWSLHGAYSSTEVLKWLLGLAVSGKLVLEGRRRSGAGDKLDRVDKADHRHINR